MNHYYLGIDVSKGYSDFILLNSAKQSVEENFQLDDTFDGHQKLYNILSEFYTHHPKAQIYAAVESTGGYENNWFGSLLRFQGSLPLNTARLNPCGVSNNSKAGLDRNITDKISAENVAKYMIEHPEKVTYQQHDPLDSLRRQWGFVKMLIKQKTQLLNQLESNLYVANPEILPYCKNGVPNTDKCRVPEVELLKTFKGIGASSAIGLILEIGSVERFASAKKLASFFGLHPVYKKKR